MHKDKTFTLTKKRNTDKKRKDKPLIYRENREL